MSIGPGYGRKVVVAMSGGVDSSVAAALLQRQGYDVVGCFMRLGTPAGVDEGSSCGTTATRKQGCCSVSDAADAHRVAGLLGIPLYVLNFQAEFGRVIDYFVSEYNRGRTPNPCVRCNDWLKFGRLAKYAEAIGADHVASGHYARIGTDPVTGRPTLMRGVDGRKDQSYVLFGMPAEAVARTLLPIGEMEKPAVRALAEELGLPVFDKPDSQEICFVPDGDYAGLVRRRTPAAFAEGELVTAGGDVVGSHGGHQQFTVGQRKGLGVALGYPIYVVEIDPVRNRVTVGGRDDLLRRGLRAADVNLLAARPALASAAGLRCGAKIRYNAGPQPATAWLAGGELRVRFDEAQSAVTPGQAVAVYDGEVVVGGGWIESAD